MNPVQRIAKCSTENVRGKKLLQTVRPSPNVFFFSTLSWFVHKRRHGRRLRVWGTGHRLGKEVFQFRKRGFGLGLITGGLYMGDFGQGGFGPGTYVTELIYGGLHPGELLLGAYDLGSYVQGFMCEGCWSTSALDKDGLRQRAE